MKNLPAKIIFVLSTLGLINAAYLTQLFFRLQYGDPLDAICDLSSTLSCSGVLTSEYSQVFGLPACTIALVVYPALMYLAYRAMHATRSQDFYFGLAVLSGMGLMFNFFVLYNEYAFIGMYCVLCIFCGAVISTNFIAALFGYFKGR